MKKLNIILILLLAVSLPLCVVGQKKMVKNYNKVSVSLKPEVDLLKSENPILVKKGNEMKVSISISVPPKYMKKKSVLRYSIVDQNGNEICAPIFVKGMKAFSQGLVVNHKTGGTVSASRTFTYNESLRDVAVSADPLLFKPKKKNPAKDTDTPEQIISGNRKTWLIEGNVIANGTIVTQDLVEPQGMVMIESGHKYEKETIISKTAAYYFPKNIATLDMKFGLNKEQKSIDALKEFKDFVAKGWVIKDLTINGFASPEGEEKLNVNLSDNRAKNADKAAAKLVKKGTKIPYAGNGPDWNGFLKLVKESDMKEKNTILNIINSADPTQKEIEINNMILIYPELESTILPKLRRAEISVNCYEPKKTDAEILNYALTDPSKLNIEEIMYASIELAKSDADRMTILKNAMKIDSNDPRVYNNLAVVQLRTGDLKGASENINMASKLSPDNKEIINNVGVVYANQGDYKTAKTYFAKTKTKTTEYNMGLCDFLEGQWNEAANIVNKKCDYNSALIKTMLKDYAASATMLNCAPKTAETLYLQAINESRQGNNDKCMEYLKESIKMDANKKVQASKDVEFINLFNNPNFQSLIK